MLVFTTHVFRMTTFFLVAGFFAHMSFHRRGVTAFIGDRLKRIAMPLAVGSPIVFGANLAVAAWAPTKVSAPLQRNSQPFHTSRWPTFGFFTCCWSFTPQCWSCAAAWP